MRIELLGPVEAHRAGGDLAPLGGVRLRGLLARLALDAGRPVTAATLVDDIWGDAPPDAAGNALQALVSRLRRAIGPELVDTAASGYRLRVGADDVDALRFDGLLGAAVAAPDHAHTLLGQALALWRGPALADIRDLPFAGPAADRLAERRAVAVEQRAGIALRQGLVAPDGLAAELDELARLLDAEPLRESTAALLARGLHAVGRQADALAVVDRTRARLADELGVDPGPQLASARQAVLRGERPAPRRASAPTADGGALDSFVGRGADVARVRELLARGRLVTLTGPGGAGKTRLAREATASPAHSNVRALVETRLAELAPLADPAQLPAALLTAVGAAELHIRGPATPERDRLRAAVADRELVLVLDNCEHLVDAVAALTHDLLAAAPRLRVLATSREPLGVPGEVLHPVEALADPDAMRLFADRAGAVRPGFTVTVEVAPAVAEICRRLDGQPLPIELAAARLRTLFPAEIATRLDDRFRLLTGGARTALARHQTLRAVVDWSWELLTEPERALARRLAVFAGGATLAALEQVGPAAGGPPAADTLDVLTALVDKSLVQAVPQPAGVLTRYRMLETIREYAVERLDEAGERESIAAAHSAHFLALVEAAEPHLRGAGQLPWLARLRIESGNIEAALRRAVAARDAMTAHRLVAALAWSWLIRGLADETTSWVAAACALPGPVPVATRALVTAYRAFNDVDQGEFDAARRHVAEATALAAGVASPRHPTLDLMGPTVVAFVDGDDEPIAALAQQHPDPWVRAFALMMHAHVAERRGDLDAQRGLVRAAHVLPTEIGDRFGLGMVLHSLGELEDLAGELDAAARAYDEAIALATELGNGDDLPQFLVQRARLDLRRGDPAAAHARLDEAFEQARDSAEAMSALHLTRFDAHRRTGDLDAARAALVLVGESLQRAGPGVAQRRVVHAGGLAALVLAETGPAAAAAPLVAAVTAAVESKDGPAVATIAELAARARLAAGDPSGAAQLLGVATTQRGTLDRGDPEVMAVLAAVRDALGPAAAELAVQWGRELPHADGLALLAELARGLSGGLA